MACLLVCELTSSTPRVGRWRGPWLKLCGRRPGPRGATNDAPSTTAEKGGRSFPGRPVRTDDARAAIPLPAAARPYPPPRSSSLLRRPAPASPHLSSLSSSPVRSQSSSHLPFYSSLPSPSYPLLFRPKGDMRSRSPLRPSFDENSVTKRSMWSIGEPLGTL